MKGFRRYLPHILLFALIALIAAAPLALAEMPGKNMQWGASVSTGTDNISPEYEPA